MKTLLLAFSFFSASAWAAPAIPSFCTGGNCSAPMLSILQDFNRAGRILDSAIVASGECFHLDNAYDPAQVQYGYLLLDPKDGFTYMSGSFGFFYPENPYAHLNVESARALLDDPYEDYRRMDKAADYAYMNFDPQAAPENQFEYWVRQSGERLLVLANWGINHQMFCRMERNL
jgi:hypothetical protein